MLSGIHLPSTPGSASLLAVGIYLVSPALYSCAVALAPRPPAPEGWSKEITQGEDTHHPDTRAA